LRAAAGGAPLGRPMDPLVTIVVPCYKLAHLLPQCVQSILKQSYPNYEILIMDNCSPDNTPEVAASFNDPRVKHIRNETNIGHVRNFNKGITMASGKYVMLISPDDWLGSEQSLTHYVEMLEKNPDAGFAFCRAIEVQGNKEMGIASWTDLGKEDSVWEGPSFLMQLIQGDCVVLSAAMVRKECYEKYGMFSLEMPHANDWFLWCVLSLHHKVIYLAEPMMYVRLLSARICRVWPDAGSASSRRTCLGPRSTWVK